jgi:hypothetical protein
MAGACVVAGATLLAAYAVLFLLLLRSGHGAFDYASLVISPYWRPLALIAFVGIILILAGIDAIHARLQESASAAAAVGLLLTKVALVLQACVLTWELLLDPIIAGHSESAFLLRDRVIVTNSSMVAFQLVFLVASSLGALLFGTAVYRSGQFSRVATVLVVCGALTYAIGPLVSVLLAVAGVGIFALGGAWIGATLWRPPAPRSQPVGAA